MILATASGANQARTPGDARARVAVDLGAQSCRVSLLQWQNGQPEIRLVHRIANAPVHASGALRWPFERIFAGIDEGLRKAAGEAPEGIASIAVDGWAVDYVRLDVHGHALAEPYCYRDERTVRTKAATDRVLDQAAIFGRTGALPLRINTVYQLLADREEGIDPRTPWINLPEYVLYRLGGRRVSEYTNATHTGLVDLETREWSRELMAQLNLPAESFPTIVRSGSVLGTLTGPLAELPALRRTQLIAPGCHDTASAIAGIPKSLTNTAYICSGTWSLVGTCIENAVTSPEALAGGFTNQGAVGGGFCFHTNVNGMWLLQQCMEKWRQDGRSCELRDLVALSDTCERIPGLVDVDEPALLLDGDMPALVNAQLLRRGCAPIEDQPGNEPLFARVLFESLAARYASAVRNLERLAGRRIERVHLLGGGSLNRVLTRLTKNNVGVPVETGNVESSTVGNLAVQLAVAEAPAKTLDKSRVRVWAARLSEHCCRDGSSAEHNRERAQVTR